MPKPQGFSHVVRKNGEVIIYQQGPVTTVLRGSKAERFMADVLEDDQRALMARLSGNYKRGNRR